jgi:hypothetical protein
LTRSRLPGPEPAETLNKLAEARNVAKYGDPLGFKNSAQIREIKPEITTEGIIESAGRTSPRVTGGAAIGGLLGTLGGFLMVKDLADHFAGRKELNEFAPGSVELDPTDFDVGSEWTKSLGWENGSEYFCKVRVERNLLGRRRFYLVDVWTVV